MFVRFSTVAGSKGSVDLPLDVRGFAVKLYTKEGNWDIVGNNIPVFFIQDAIKFPDMVHAVKPAPDRDFPQAQSAHDNFWDFISLMPESTHMIMWLMSDRALPRSFRFMEGFGVHTFRFVNAAGVSTFVKFHWKPLLGLQSVVWNEAVKINGADPDFHRRDLWNSITSGAFPEWELGVQLFDDAFADSFEFDILDSTKLIPEEQIPIRPVGKLVLNRTVDNFFAETEQVAFCTANIVPGVDFTNDPLLQGRNLSYLDTQIKRLGGPNFSYLPVNAPRCPVAHFQQDGHMATANPVGRVNYEPNTRGPAAGPRETPESGFRSVKTDEQGGKRRARPASFADHFIVDLSVVKRLCGSFKLAGVLPMLLLRTQTVTLGAQGKPGNSLSSERSLPRERARMVDGPTPFVGTAAGPQIRSFPSGDAVTLPTYPDDDSTRSPRHRPRHVPGLAFPAVAVALGVASLLSMTNTAEAGIVPTVVLATSANYSVLAHTIVTNTNPSVIGQSVGLSPGTTVVGFPPGVVLAPAIIDAASPVTLQAQNDLTSAYVDAAGRSVEFTLTNPDLVGNTFIPGVYAATAKAPLGLSGQLVLDGQNNPNAVFIFQTDSTLITSTASSIVLINGASECNVFWQVGSSATLGSGSVFVGNILALTSITVQSAVVVHGRTLARTGAVTLDNDTFTAPSCIPSTATSPPTTTTTPATTTPATTTLATTTPATTTAGTATSTPSTDTTISPAGGTASSNVATPISSADTATTIPPTGAASTTSFDVTTLTLPSTGSNLATTSGLGTLALLVGAGTVLAVRRRRST